MNCDDLKLSLYLDGELPERAELERHLAECERCRARLDELKRADNLLGQAADRMAPPVVRPVYRFRRRLWKIPAVAAAVLLVAAMGGLVWVNLQTADPQEVRVVAGATWFSGTRSRTRVLVTDYRGQRPIAGARVKAILRHDERELARGEAVSGPDGSAEVGFDVPEDFEGSAYVSYLVISEIATDSMFVDVRVVRPARILLTTDKPVYQPDQTIHIRALAMNNFSMKPLANAEAVLEIEDPNGTKIFKKAGRASEFGIFAADFRLADEVNLGTYRIRGRVGGIESERTVEVSHYVLPKFGIAMTTDRSFYAPGETLTATVEARYFFPQPVAGGRVEVQWSDHRTTGTLDDRGRWTFDARVPNVSELRFEVMVEDGARHVERKTLRVPVSGDPILISVVPVFGKIVPSIENSLYVVTAYPDGKPARCRISSRAGNVETDEAGVATLPIGRGRQALRITADDGERTVSFDYEPQASTRDFAILTEPSVRAGETMTITALASSDMTLYLDLVQNDQTVLMKSLEVRNGRGTLPIDLPTELFGAVRVSAYRVQPDGEIARDTRIVLVDPPGDLVIRPKLSKAEYRPGEEVSIDFEVLDSSGKPVTSAVTLGVVDEAVFALAEARPGLEKAYFQAVEDLLQPRFQLKAPLPDRVRCAADERRVPDMCNARYRDKLAFVDRWIESYNAFARIAAAWVLGTAFVVGFVIVFLHSVRRAQHGDSGCLTGLLMIVIVIALVLLLLPAVSRSMRTAKTQLETYLREEKAGGTSPGIDGSVSSPRLREWFPETLYWNSQILAEGGRAHVAFRAADSITTWRMSMSAVSRDGRLGSAVDGLKVFQPFFIDLDVPLSLTEGDELWIPIAVYNYTDRRDTLALRVTVEDGIELLDPAEQKLDVEPKQVTSVRCRIRAAKFGTRRLEVLATAGSFADRVARTLEIAPDGKAIPFAVGDRLQGRSSMRFTIPADAIDGASRVWARLYPSSHAEIVTGLDSLIRMPYG